METHLHVRPVNGFCTHVGSNDADSCKDVHFWDFFHIAPHLGVKTLKKTSLTRKIEKRAYYQNYCIDSNQILHSDKDHQMPFMGGPNTRITNPRWRTAAILEKSKNRYISAAVWAISTKIWHGVAVRSFLPFRPLKFEISKIQEGGVRQLEKSKNSHISPNSCDFDEIWQSDAVCPFWPLRSLKIWNFKNLRWR